MAALAAPGNAPVVRCRRRGWRAPARSARCDCGSPAAARSRSGRIVPRSATVGRAGRFSPAAAQKPPAAPPAGRSRDPAASAASRSPRPRRRGRAPSTTASASHSQDLLFSAGRCRRVADVVLPARVARASDDRRRSALRAPRRVLPRRRFARRQAERRDRQHAPRATGTTLARLADAGLTLSVFARHGHRRRRRSRVSRRLRTPVSPKRRRLCGGDALDGASRPAFTAPEGSAGAGLTGPPAHFAVRWPGRSARRSGRAAVGGGRPAGGAGSGRSRAAARRRGLLRRVRRAARCGPAQPAGGRGSVL